MGCNEVSKVSTFSRAIGDGRLSVRCDVLFDDNDYAMQYQCYLYDSVSESRSKMAVFEDHKDALEWMDRQ